MTADAHESWHLRSWVHDRMPVMVQPKDYQRWLDPDNQDVADVIATPPSEGWIAYPVKRLCDTAGTGTESGDVERLITG